MTQGEVGGHQDGSECSDEAAGLANTGFLDFQKVSSWVWASVRSIVFRNLRSDLSGKWEAFLEVLAAKNHLLSSKSEKDFLDIAPVPDIL